MAKTQPSFRRQNSTILKLLGVGALILVMLVPLLMIQSVLSERLARRNEAVDEITSAWGKEQNILGPVLCIPYRFRMMVVREMPTSDGRVERREVEESALGTAYFLPEVLKIGGAVQTQLLHRGIYDAAVFRAQITLSGRFGVPDFAALKIDHADVVWSDAFVTIAASDLRGTREGLVLDWGGVKRPLLPGSQLPGYTTGATGTLGNEQAITAPVEFAIPLDVNGSGGIFFAPFGVQNEAELKSNWPDPGFRGAFLPAERSVRPDGFEAKWKISYYGRDYPQQWTSRSGNERFNERTVSASLFGAQLLSILDAYRFVERSIKYGVLFFVLVFTTFFLFEMTARQKIHPFQYLMVGAALCLFYLALLSISEFIGFGWAYLI
ncbi:MAG TPA: cell envelope integrity protein CreD, partial [Chthoniobacterales bacterium]|nr:cell envelope integrity protein CreD [Chthoniobacterales bacterium]